MNGRQAGGVDFPLISWHGHGSLKDSISFIYYYRSVAYNSGRRLAMIRRVQHQ
jgi:hypothetical protein